MAQVSITANIQRNDIIKKILMLLSEKFEVKFNHFHVWQLAFFLSLKSNIARDKLEAYKTESVSEDIKMNIETMVDEEMRYLFVNLLSLVHSQKVEIKEEFPELLKLHCRHGFDILESEIIHLEQNGSDIIDFFINHLEVPNPSQEKINNQDDELVILLTKALVELQSPLKFVEKKSFQRVEKFYYDIEDLKYATSNKLYGKDLIIQLETATALRDKIYIQPTHKERTVCINIIQDTQPIYLEPYKNEIDANDLTIMLGVDDEDSVHKVNLKTLPHLLVAGTTGSGKTVFLHSLIHQLIQKNIELYLIDGKRGHEFGQYSQKSHVVVQSEMIVPTISDIIEMMENRFSSTTLEDEKPIVVIVDEFVDLIMQEKIIEDLFVRLAQKGRGAKIYLILATQRPDSKILKGVLRSNIPSRVAFKVQKSTESKIILDETGAENLFGKGDMLFSDGNSIQRLQGFLVE